jgi:hypothetical protein
MNKELSSASLRNWNVGMLECWNVGFGRLGKWDTDKQLDEMLLFHYSIIPSFHYSCLEYAEWLGGDSRLSTICRISDTLIFHPKEESK